MEDGAVPVGFGAAVRQSDTKPARAASEPVSQGPLCQLAQSRSVPPVPQRGTLAAVTMQLFKPARPFAAAGPIGRRTSVDQGVSRCPHAINNLSLPRKVPAQQVHPGQPVLYPVSGVVPDGRGSCGQ